MLCGGDRMMNGWVGRDLRNEAGKGSVITITGQEPTWPAPGLTTRAIWKNSCWVWRQLAACNAGHNEVRAEMQDVVAPNGMSVIREGMQGWRAGALLQVRALGVLILATRGVAKGSVF